MVFYPDFYLLVLCCYVFWKGPRLRFHGIEFATWFVRAFVESNFVGIQIAISGFLKSGKERYAGWRSSRLASSFLYPRKHICHRTPTVKPENNHKLFIYFFHHCLFKVFNKLNWIIFIFYWQELMMSCNYI